MFRALIAVAALLAAQQADARDWKVTDPARDTKVPDARLRLTITKTQIRVVRESDGAELRSIAPADVVAMWYDDRAVRAHAREWWDRMDAVCHSICTGEDVMIPLTLAALGGAGYLAAVPFEKREHFVNIQYRAGGAVELLTLRTNWFDHFWLMTDLSSAAGRKWLNVPLQRAKLFWTWTDRRQSVQRGARVGDVALNDGEYDVLLWDDGKGRGILLFFGIEQTGVAPLVAAEPVTVEKAGSRRVNPMYCARGDLRQLQRMQVGSKVITLPSAGRVCGS